MFIHLIYVEIAKNYAEILEKDMVFKEIIWNLKKK